MKRVKGKTEGGKGKGRRKRRKVKGDERGWKGKQSRNKLAKWKWAWREMEEKRRCSVSDCSFATKFGIQKAPSFGNYYLAHID